MNIHIQSIHFTADQKLLEFIQKKVSKLTRYYNHILGSEVYLKLDKASNLENKVVEIRLQIPGNDLFVKRVASSFEEATDDAVEALRTQVKKHKERTRRSLNKRNRKATVLHKNRG